MPKKKGLSTGNLEALGSARLAQLLMELADGDAALKRRLRLEIAAAQSPEDLAKEVSKRLAVIARSRSFVDWPNLQALADDLETQRRTIAERIVEIEPREALDLMWRFIALANSTMERCDDSNGTIIEIFRSSCADLGEIAEKCDRDEELLAERAFAALNEDRYGQCDGLIRILAPVLRTKGLERLKALILELAKKPAEKPRKEDRRVIGWGSGGPIFADDIAERRRQTTIRVALQDIADAQGDVDGFVAQQSAEARTVPRVAAEIARRLLAAGRAREALAALDAVTESRPGWLPFEWEQARVDVLEALGRREDARAFRWKRFEQSLDERHLRGFLKQLPDFDDQEAEERAMSHALRFPDVHKALAFLVTWPALGKAAELARTRSTELNGDHYEILSPSADALASRHPLAATVLLRAMIDFSLEGSRASRYRHAARHLAECAILAGAITDFDTLEPHAVYVDRLRKEHGRKAAFWSLVP